MKMALALLCTIPLVFHCLDDEQFFAEWLPVRLRVVDYF